MNTVTRMAAASAGLAQHSPERPMNRIDLVHAVAEQADLTKTKADLAVSAMLGTIGDALQRGRVVRLTGFGTFETARRKATIGRNPRTGEPIRLDASVSVRFRAGKSLKQVVATV